MEPSTQNDAVLVTGAAGATAAAIVNALHAAGRRIVGLDLPGTQPSELVDRWVAGSVLDRALLVDAVPPGGSVVHAAVALDRQDYLRVEPAMTTNVAGAYMVFDAAQARQARHVVLLSSAAVHTVGNDAAWVSSCGRDHLYDVTKRLQEGIARDFVETFGLTVTVLRLGHVVDAVAGVSRTGQTLDELDYCRGGWVCCHDVGRAVTAALDQDTRGLSLFHVIGSPEARNRFDIDATEAALGFHLDPCQ